MNSTKSKMLSVLLVALVIIISATSAQAALTIAQTETYSGVPNFEDSLTFDKFDDMGGTRNLLSIEVTVNLNVDGGQLILDNDGAGFAVGTFEFGAKAEIASTDVTLLDTTFQPVTSVLQAIYSGTFDLASDTGDVFNDFDPLAPDGMRYNGGVESDSDSGFVASAPEVFSQYIGTDTFDIAVTADQWQGFGGASGIEWAVTPVSAEGDVTIVYSYEVVPEPATMGLLALGGLLIRRKRK